MATPSFKEFAESAFLSEGDVEIKEAKFTMFSWEKKDGTFGGEPTPLLQIVYEDLNGTVHRPEIYGLGGDSSDWQVIDGGKSIDSKKDKFGETCKFSQFMKSLYSSGLKPDVVNDNDITSLVGIRGHVTTVAYKLSDGKDTTVLLFDKITGTPGVGSGTGSGKGEDDVAVTELATNIMVDVLAVTPEIPIKGITTAASKTDAYKSLIPKAKQSVLALLRDKEFLAGSDVWSFDAKTQTVK